MSDPLKELKQQGRFYDFLHVAWGIMELKADESVLKAYCLSSQDVRATLLLSFGITKQLELFRSMAVLSATDFKTICDFRDKRNNLFHTGGLFALNLTIEEKEEIMDVGLKAVNIMNSLSDFLGQRQGQRYVYLKKEKEETKDML